MARRASNPDRTQVEVSRWATVWFICFMAGVPFMSAFDPLVLRLIRDLLFLPMSLYITIQFLETLNREFTDEGGFFADNALAVAAFFTAAITFVLWAFRVRFYNLSWDQVLIMLQCMVWAAVDLSFGLLFSFRIAGSGKQREEERAH